MLEDDLFLYRVLWIHFGKCIKTNRLLTFVSQFVSQRRFVFIQSLVDSFWKIWTQCYFPSLLIRQKWHHEKCNMRIGDVVLIQDKHLVRGQWRMGRVPGDDGKVRDVSVEYKIDGANSFTSINRPVQRLVLLMPYEGIDPAEP